MVAESGIRAVSRRQLRVFTRTVAGAISHTSSWSRSIRRNFHRLPIIRSLRYPDPDATIMDAREVSHRRRRETHSTLFASIRGSLIFGGQFPEQLGAPRPGWPAWPGRSRGPATTRPPGARSARVEEAIPSAGGTLNGGQRPGPNRQRLMVSFTINTRCRPNLTCLPRVALTGLQDETQRRRQHVASSTATDRRDRDTEAAARLFGKPPTF